MYYIVIMLHVSNTIAPLTHLLFDVAMDNTVNNVGCKCQ